MSVTPPAGELFFDDVVRAYVEAPHFVERRWLAERVEGALSDTRHRIVLLTALPGAGKSAFAAWLVRRHPGWLRYFIRRDSESALNRGDVRSFLFAVGHQLAALRPPLFHPEQLEIVVKQRIGVAAAGSTVTGIRIEDLRVSPFYKTALRVEQEAGILLGHLEGLSVQRVVAEKRFLEVANLEHLALLDPAAALAASDRTAQIVVIVDALDELRFQPGGETILSWLAGSPALPANVRFVVTSRPDTDLLRPLRDGQHEWLHEESIPRDAAEVRGDLTRYADGVTASSAFARALAERRLSGETFTEAVVTKADGNFQFLVALARAVEAALEPKVDKVYLSSLLRLEGVPSGLEKLYAYFLTRIREQARSERIDMPGPGPFDSTPIDAWTGVYQPILGVLAVALDALNADQIGRFTGIPGDSRWLTDALARLGQFLEPKDGRLRLYHASFQEFLTSAATRTSQRHWYLDPGEWHRKIAAHFRGRASTWNDVAWNEDDDYGLLRLPAHLEALARAASADTAAVYRRELYGLVCRSFMLAKRRRFGSHRPFADDVRRAVEVARTATPPDIVEEIRERFLHVTLREMATDISDDALHVLARLGRAEQARSWVALISQDERRRNSYLDIARASLSGGHRSDAWETLAQAAIDAEAAGDAGTRQAALMAIAERQAEAGAFDGAVALATRIAREVTGQGEVAEGWAQGWLAPILARTNRYAEAAEAADRALALVEKNPHPDPRVWILTRVVIAYSDIGREADALQAASLAVDHTGLIREEYAKDLARLWVVYAFARLPRSDRGSSLWNEALSMLHAQPELIAYAARSLLDVGYREVAADLAQRAIDWSDDVGTRASAVEVLAAAGCRDQGLAALERIQRDAERNSERLTYDLATIAAAALACGETARAVGLARRALDASGDLDEDERASARDAALSGLARALIGAGEYDEAERTAELTDDRARTWVTVATALLDAGQRQRAADLLDRALVAAETADDAQSKPLMFARVAAVLTRAGQREAASALASRALAAAKAITLEAPQAKALLRVADAMARTGNASQAADVAEDVLARGDDLAATYWKETERGRVTSLTDVARIVALAGRARRGMEIAVASKDRDEMATELAEVAHALAEMGYVDEAVKATKRSAALVNKGLDSLDSEAWVLIRLAEAMLEGDRRADAARLARRAAKAAGGIEDFDRKADALKTLAPLLSRAGASVAARRAAEDARAARTEAIDRLHALRSSEIAAVAGVSASLDDSADAADRAQRVFAKAKGMSKSGWGSDVDEGDGAERAEALAGAAAALAAAGNHGDATEAAEQALAIARECGTGLKAAETWTHAARALAYAGRGDAATEAASRAAASLANEDHRARLRVTADFSLALASIGDMAEARETARLALKAAEHIPGDVLRWMALEQAARALAASGQREAAVDAANAALAAAESIRSVGGREQIMYSLAASFADAGLSDEGLAAWRSGFTLVASRSDVLFALERGASVLSAAGLALQACDAIDEVDRWWQPDAATVQSA